MSRLLALAALSLLALLTWRTLVQERETPAPASPLAHDASATSVSLVAMPAPVLTIASTSEDTVATADAPSTAPSDALGAAPASEPPDAPETFRLVVLDADRQPVDAARVRIWPSRDLTSDPPLADTLCDARGRCTVSLPDRNAVVHAEKPGVGSSCLLHRGWLNWHRDASGETPVHLVATAHLSGRPSRCLS